MNDFNKTTHFVFKPFQRGTEGDEGVVVFSNWILESLLKDQSAQDPILVTIVNLKEKLASSLELDFASSQRTEALLKSSLTYLTANNLISTPDDLKSIKITNLGKSHINKLLDEQQSFEARTLTEFLGIIYDQSLHLQAGDQVNEKQKKEFVSALFENDIVKQSLPIFLNRISHLRGEKYVEAILLTKQLAEPFEKNPQRPETPKEGLKQPAELARVKSPIAGIDFQLGLEKAARFVLHMSEWDSGRYPSIDYWIWQHNYESLFRRLWPDQELRERISSVIASLYVYLDTSVIVAALCESDPLHQRAKVIIDFLDDKKAKIFWLAPTDKELRAHIELARTLVEMIEPERRHPHEVQHLLDVADVPSLTRAFIQGDLRNWKKFESNLMQGYSALLKASRKSTKQVIDAVASDDIFRALQADLKSSMRQLLRNEPLTRNRKEAVLEHDANVLASIQVLRDAPPRNFAALAKGPAHEDARKLVRELVWLVSFDRTLFQVTYDSLTREAKEFLNKGEKSTAGQNRDENVPLVLLYDTILLFMDPFIVSNDFYRLDRPQGRRLKPLSSVEDMRSAAKDHYNRMQITRDIRETISRYSNQLTQQYKEINTYQVIDESF